MSTQSWAVLSSLTLRLASSLSAAESGATTKAGGESRSMLGLKVRLQSSPGSVSLPPSKGPHLHSLSPSWVLPGTQRTVSLWGPEQKAAVGSLGFNIPHLGGGAVPDSAASKIQRLIFHPVIMENNPAEKHASRAGGGGAGGALLSTLSSYAGHEN